MLPPPLKLSELLDRAAADDLPSAWLYLPKDWRTLNAHTPVYLVDIDADGDSAAADEAAREQEYESTIDDYMLRDLVEAVRVHFKTESFEARLEALVYYVRFDAFLPRLGAPDPPPWEETRAMMDRMFYDSLGPERAEEPCRAPGCNRGAVAMSVLCKVHHFEQVQKRVCPFSD